MVLPHPYLMKWNPFHCSIHYLVLDHQALDWLVLMMPYFVHKRNVILDGRGKFWLYKARLRVLIGKWESSWWCLIRSLYIVCLVRAITWRKREIPIKVNNTNFKISNTIHLFSLNILSHVSHSLSPFRSALTISDNTQPNEWNFLLLIFCTEPVLATFMIEHILDFFDNFFWHEFWAI